MNKKRKSDHTDKRNRKNEGKSQIDDYGRRVWDKDFYKQKAEEKNVEDESESIIQLLPEYKKPKVFPTVTEKIFLEERKEELSLDKNLGKIQIFTLKSTKEQQGGYYCEICDCVVKDSQTYLDHINGKNHNKMLGYSMKVKSVTVDDVKKKLSDIKNKKKNKLEQMIRDPYEEAKQAAKELEEIEESKRQRRKEKRMFKKMELEGNKIKEEKNENSTEKETRELNKVEGEQGSTKGDEQKDEEGDAVPIKEEDVDGKEEEGKDEEEEEEEDDDENALAMEMEKMGLPTAFA